MIAALERALKEGKPILDASYRENITKLEFANILKGNTEIPLLDERYNIFKETGTSLNKLYQGNFANLVKQAEGNINALLELLVIALPSFRDVSMYKGREIYFYKRAQLLISDIFQMFDGKNYGSFSNASELTACADYKLPQALRKFGILEYSQSLANKVDNKIELTHGSEEEVEIRANTIWAVEYIRRELQPRMPNISSTEINDHIWLYTQTKYPNDLPYHLSLTTAY